jgi:hypothetical protein
MPRLCAVVLQWRVSRSTPGFAPGDPPSDFAHGPPGNVGTAADLVSGRKNSGAAPPAPLRMPSNRDALKSPRSACQFYAYLHLVETQLRFGGASLWSQS